MTRFFDTQGDDCRLPIFDYRLPVRLEAGRRMIEVGKNIKPLTSIPDLGQTYKAQNIKQ